ncbi:MAG: HAD family hydrolase [Finegoldia sp.]|nr:HAD family hydrolase [Finegoldia sp.]
MTIKAVIFDKDGTLIEFSDLWRSALEEVFEKYNLDQEIIKEIRKKVGIQDDKTIVENSVLAAGTMKDLVDILSDYISLDEEDLYLEVSNHFLAYMKNHKEMIRETCDLKSLFKKLKDQGIKIGVITADDYRQADLCFDLLGLKDDIEFLATGDRYLNKPDPSSLDAFCKKFDLDRSEVAMVGDSEIDMLLGKKAGLAIGVLSGTGTRQGLEKSADLVLDSVCDLASVIKAYTLG